MIGTGHRRRPAALLLLLLVLGSACAREGEENLGLIEPKPPAVANVQKLADPQVLLQVAQLLHQELPRRLGGVRLSLHTTWDVTPPVREGTEAAGPVQMEEQSVYLLDAAGGIRALHSNDHGYGSEMVYVGGQVYMRLRYAPFVRRRPEGDEVSRVLQSGDNSAALLALLVPFLDIDVAPDAGGGAGLAGRPALKLTLGKRSGAPVLGKKSAADSGPGRVWRRATRVEALRGTARVDREQGALLALDLSATFVGPRLPGPGDRAPAPPPGDVTVKVHHTLELTALEQAVAAPEEWQAPPVRPRPQQDRQELLQGLVPGPIGGNGNGAR